MRKGRELRIGLVEDDERGIGTQGRSLEQGFQGLRGNPGPRGIVGQGEPQLPRTGLESLEPRFQGEARPHRHLEGPAPVPGDEERIEAEARVRVGNHVARREPGQSHQIQHIAAGGAQHQTPVGHSQAPSQPFREFRLTLWVLVEGHDCKALQERFAGSVRPVRRGFVHVQAGLPQTGRFRGRAGVRLDGGEIGAEEIHGFTFQSRRRAKKDSPRRHGGARRTEHGERDRK